MFSSGHHHLCHPPSGSRSCSQSLVSIGEADSQVLERSCTSGSIMQALCYLEAILRPEIPEILRGKKLGVRAYLFPSMTSDELQDRAGIQMYALLSFSFLPCVLTTTKITTPRKRPSFTTSQPVGCDHPSCSNHAEPRIFIHYLFEIK